MRALIVGASGGIGRAVAEQLAGDAWDLVLVARSARDLEALARHLSLTCGVAAEARLADVCAPDFDAAAWLGEVTGAAPLDAVVVTVGTVSGDDHYLSSPALIDTLTKANFTAPAGIVGEAARYFTLAGRRGSIVVCGSIAAFAPRSRNLAYGAGKAALHYYCRGLRHSLVGRGVSLSLVALGYVDTSMSQGRTSLFPAAPPAAAADFLVRRLSSDGGTFFYPRYWRWIVTLLGALPWALYKRLRF